MRYLYLGLFFLLIGCRDKKPTQNIPTLDRPAVTLITPQARLLDSDLQATGIVAHHQDVRLAFKTPGLIKKIWVQEGQRVQAGQLLAELDLSEIQAQTEQARLAVEKATRDYERAKRLVNDQAAVPQAMDDARTGLEAAQQQLKTAQFNLQLSRIYAPSTGLILRKLAEPGELMGAFQPVLLLGTGNAPQIVKVGVSARNLVQIQIGQPVELRLEAYPGQSFSGKVTQKAVAPSPGTGQYEVDIQIDPTRWALQSGFLAQAIFAPASQKTSLSIPIEALVEAQGEEAFVFVFDSQTQRVKKTKVKLGKSIHRWIEITEGLQSSDSLVSAGANFLTDSELVKPIR